MNSEKRIVSIFPCKDYVINETLRKILFYSRTHPTNQPGLHYNGAPSGTLVMTTIYWDFMNIPTAQNVFVNGLREALPAVGNNVFTHGEFNSRSVATVGQELLTPAKKQASLFKYLQQRTINGRGSGKSVDCLVFLANLVKRQLLLSSELEVLGRALAQGECVIEPALCRSSQGIDALRLLSAFLMVLHKSPQISKALDGFIDQAPVLSGSEYFHNQGAGASQEAGSYDHYSVANIKRLQGNLVLVLKKYDAVTHILPMLCGGEKIQYLKGLLEPLMNEMTSFQCTARLLTHLNDSDSDWLLRIRLIDLVKNLEYSIRSMDHFDGRIDHLDIAKVLVINPQSSQYFTLLGYTRGLSGDIPSSDPQQLETLLDCSCLLDGKYVDIMQCRSIDFKSVNTKDILSNSPVKKETGYLWVYFRGVHLEFDLSYPWGSNSDLNLIVSYYDGEVLCPLLRNHNVRRWLKLTGLASYKWIVGLYLELHKWLDESRPEADKAHAITFQMKIWDCEYSTLDDFHWLISAIVRSGLRPYSTWDSTETISLLCPDCTFDVELRRRDCFTGTHFIQQLQSQFLELVGHHKQNRECTVAQSVEPARLWCERQRQT